jgi:hypothetical protein
MYENVHSFTIITFKYFWIFSRIFWIFCIGKKCFVLNNLGIISLEERDFSTQPYAHAMSVEQECVVSGEMLNTNKLSKIVRDFTHHFQDLFFFPY